MSTIEDTIRATVREEVRAAVRDELRAALAELRPAAPADTLLTVEQVAQRAGGVAPETVREWIRNGRLEARRAGHRFLVAPQALDSFLTGIVAKPTELGADEHLSLLIDRIGNKRAKLCDACWDAPKSATPSAPTPHEAYMRVAKAVHRRHIRIVDEWFASAAPNSSPAHRLGRIDLAAVVAKALEVTP